MKLVYRNLYRVLDWYALTGYWHISWLGVMLYLFNFLYERKG